MKNSSDDYVIGTLKEKYFALIRKEEIGMTPKITQELDNIEEAIRKLQAK